VLFDRLGSIFDISAWNVFEKKLEGRLKITGNETAKENRKK
jgi:hypothetical protein